jgi:hypothetical protein
MVDTLVTNYAHGTVALALPCCTLTSCIVLCTLKNENYNFLKLKQPISEGANTIVIVGRMCAKNIRVL